MIRVFSGFLMGLVLLVAAPAAKADGCDDIARVSKETKAPTPFTKAFGDALAKEGKGKDTARLRALGKQIFAAIEELGELGEADDWDEDVKIIDRLVEVLDKVVDSCA